MRPKPEPFVIVGDGFSLTIPDPWIHLDVLREHLSDLGVEWAWQTEREATHLAEHGDLEYALYTITQMTKVMIQTLNLPQPLHDAIAQCRHGADLAFARIHGDAREDQQSTTDK